MNTQESDTDEENWEYIGPQPIGYMCREPSIQVPEDSNLTIRKILSESDHNIEKNRPPSHFLIRIGESPSIKNRKTEHLKEKIPNRN